MLYAVRGAVGIESDCAQAITAGVEQLMQALVRQNHLLPQEVLTVFFTMTTDLHTLNPAMALRTVLPDWNGVPLLCAVEPEIDLLPFCIRVLIQWQPKIPPQQTSAVYLGSAQSLRPDLVSKSV